MSGPCNGTGNTLNNLIIGYLNGNTLDGGGGNDELKGIDGNDSADRRRGQRHAERRRRRRHHEGRRRQRLLHRRRRGRQGQRGRRQRHRQGGIERQLHARRGRREPGPDGHRKHQTAPATASPMSCMATAARTSCSWRQGNDTLDGGARRRHAEGRPRRRYLLRRRVSAMSSWRTAGEGKDTVRQLRQLHDRRQTSRP